MYTLGMYSDTSNVTFLPRSPVTTIQQPTSLNSGGSVSVATTPSPLEGKSFFHTVGVFIIVATTVSALGAYTYVSFLQSQQTRLLADIQKKQQIVDLGTVAKIQKINEQIQYAEKLVGGHITLTPIFQSLHEKTLKDIQFDSFQYKETEEQGGSNSAQPPKVLYQAIFKGKARTYESIAQQSDELYAPDDLGSESLFKHHFFSDFKTNRETNLIDFILTVDLPVDRLVYSAIETNSSVTENTSQSIYDNSVNINSSSDLEQENNSQSQNIPSDQVTTPVLEDKTGTSPQSGSATSSIFSVPPVSRDRVDPNAVSLKTLSESLIKKDLANR